jgi:hypothetical protein
MPNEQTPENSGVSNFSEDSQNVKIAEVAEIFAGMEGIPQNQERILYESDPDQGEETTASAQVKEAEGETEATDESSDIPATQPDGQPKSEQAGTEEPVEAIDMKSELEELRETVRELLADKFKGDTPVGEMKVPPQGLPLKDIQFLPEGSDINSIFESPQTFNKLLNTVAASAVEATLSAIPSMVEKRVISAVTEKAVAERFVKDNPLLMPYNETVAKIIDKTQHDNPGLTLEQIMEKSAKIAYMHLGIRRPAVKQTSAPAQPAAPVKIPAPALPKKMNLSTLKKPAMSAYDKSVADVLAGYNSEDDFVEIKKK